MQDFTSSYLYGMTAVLHPCSLITTFNALQLLLNISLQNKRSEALPVFFILGYALSVLTIGMLTITGLAQSTTLSSWLKDFSSLFLGPLLILIGMLYAGLINFKLNEHLRFISIKQIKEQSSSAFMIGLILGISLCPATALLLFGVFIPFTVNSPWHAWLFIPYILGVITPLLITSLLLIRSQQFLKKHHQWSQKLGIFSGTLLILSGIYHSLKNIF